MNWKKIHMIGWGRTLLSRCPVTHHVGQKIHENCVRGLYAARLLFLRFRSQWNLLTSWKSNVITRGNKLNLTSLETWMATRKAPALDHTLKLFHEIKEKGFKIFLISTRRESLRDATVANLIKEGYHGWSSLVLRGLEDENKHVQKYKAEIRKKLVNEGYRIWGTIGDQWSSFDGSPSAKRTFKLPNSLYYIS